MTDNYDKMDVLLAKKFANEATPEEERQIENWLKNDPKNEKYHAEMQWLWENAPKGQAGFQKIDTEKALQKVKRKLRPGAKIIPLHFWRMAVAAAVVLALGAVWFFKNGAAGESAEIANSGFETMNEVLADGSEITLNRNSGLALAQNFNKKERRARLRGEAFFKIAPDKTRPFIVEVEKLEVRVVGTQFNVFENETAGTVEVSVLEGKVELKSGQQKVLLGAGLAAVFDKKTGEIRPQQQPNPNVLAYQNRRFLFDSTPLGKVAEQLSKVYGSEFVFKNPRLADCLLSARYDNLPPDRVADLIAETFNFSVEKSGGRFVFDGQGCGG